MDTWRFIDSGKKDAAYNMALDEAIATYVRRGRSQPTIRFYEWESPSVSLGSFQKIADIESGYCYLNNIPIVRRPTGGRAVLHGDELTYSFSSRNIGAFSHGLMETYRQLSLVFSAALEMIGLDVEIKTMRESGRSSARSPLCFRSSSYGEISIDAKKLVGSAQKRWSDGFLQQGSIPYSINHEKLEAVFSPGGRNLKSREVGNPENPDVSALPEASSQSPFRAPEFVGLKDLVPDFDQEEFKRELKLSFERIFDVTLVGSHPSAQEETLARHLVAEKYLSLQWTREAMANMRYCNSNGISRTALQD